jgi:hypothetical protein
MADLAKKWVGGGREGLHFWCPGCDEVHQITTSPGGWGWNGSLDKPTFTPSVLVTSGHYAQGSRSQATGECHCNFEARTGQTTNFKCGVCHSFVTDGRIQFLGDCTHALANQTVDLPPWPQDGLER